jgi:stage IV sporulation protein FB
MSEFDFYPEKPVIEEKEKKGSAGLTFLTMALFVMSFLFIFSDSLLFVLSLLAVLFIHELGHFTFMKLFNYKNVKMLFIPLMGAFVQGIKDKYSQGQSLIVVLAGPIPGLLFGLLFFFLAQAHQIEWMMTFALLFIFLNVLNLLPLDPLDGGQLLRLLIKNNHDLFQLVFSLISSLALIGIGLWMDSYLFVAFGFFMGFRVRGIQKNYLIRKELKHEEVEYVSTYADLSNRQYAKIKEVLIENNSALKKYLQMNDDQVDIDPLVANQVKNILVAPMTRDTNMLKKAFIIVLWISAFLIPAYLFMNSSLDWYVSVLQNW